MYNKCREKRVKSEGKCGRVNVAKVLKGAKYESEF